MSTLSRIVHHSQKFETFKKLYSVAIGVQKSSKVIPIPIPCISKPHQTWIVPLQMPSISSNLLLTVVKFSYPSSLTTMSSSILTPPTLQ